jgi:hypothetical protein
MGAPCGILAALGRPESRYHVEDAEDFRAVAHHVAVAPLAPAQHPIAVDDEGRPPRHVPRFVEDAVGADRAAVDVAQQWEGVALSLGVIGV